MTYDTPGIRNPRTGMVERTLRPPAREALHELVVRLRDAQPGWAAQERAKILLHWRDELMATRNELVTALERDTGRRTESELEVDLVLKTIERWARIGPEFLAQGGAEATSVPGVAAGGEYVAYPLVGVISPWNFPLLLGLIDVIPALTAGCAVIVKPSEVTPRFIEPLMASVARVPELAAVLALVEGAGDVGADLIGMVDAVAFTGSVPTGRAVAEATARAFIPAFLELGGKDPAIVLAGSDLERASSAVLWGGTANAGQSCLSIERVYVEQAVYEEFVEQLVAKGERIEIGPLIDPEQAKVIERQLADAYAKGAVARTGGTVERRGGWWCRPTVLTGVDHSMAVMTEETFGPILPVMAVADAEEGVRLANDSAYGLSAAVFGPSEAAALAVARRMEAGAVSVNDASLTALVQEGEKNSFKLSGLGGSRMGPASLRRFVRRRSYLINRATAPDPWWDR